MLVIFTGTLTYIMSSKSENLMAQFKNFIPPKAMVWREGVRKEIEAIKLVPGDIVEI